MKKKIFTSLFIGIFVALYFLTPAQHYFSREGFVELQVWIEAQGNLAPFIFGLIYILATVFTLPGSILTIGGGLLFGTAWGTVINLTSSTVGALISFLIARTLGREVIQKLTRGKFKKIDYKLGGKGFYATLYLRLIPLFPFNLLNYSLGLTAISFKDYAIATLIGMAPGTFAYTSLGAAGRHIDFSNPQTWSDYHVWGPFALVILLSILPRFFKKKYGYF